METNVAPATVEFELSFFPLMFVLFLVTPSIEINGVAQRRKWGTHTFQLPPGETQFGAYYPYLFSSETSSAAIWVHLAPGGRYKLRYRPAWIVFLPGSLKLVSAPALPTATVRRLPD